MLCCSRLRCSPSALLWSAREDAVDAGVLFAWHDHIRLCLVREPIITAFALVFHGSLFSFVLLAVLSFIVTQLF